MPNYIHGRIQAKLIKLLSNNYDERYDIASEVTLDLNPRATPDLIISEKRALLDWRLVRAKESQMPITSIEIEMFARLIILASSVLIQPQIYSNRPRPAFPGGESRVRVRSEAVAGRARKRFARRTAYS